MKLFQCAFCNQVLFFENTVCGKCGHQLAYVPERASLCALEPIEDGDPSAGHVAVVSKSEKVKVRLCENYAKGACNWSVGFDEKETFCRSCRLSTIIPDLSEPELDEAWRRLEAAKRRLLYTLYGLGLPVESKTDSERGVSFSFMKGEGEKKVLTGHADGVITINVAEADDPFREKMRKQLGEAYRTVLGHFRHEIGHYYWDRLISGTPHVAKFRELFGDESQSYDDAVKRHYEQGPPPNWSGTFVSAYATMHPWEDFAETWAHYLHMVDTLETARAYGLAVRPALRASNDRLRLTSARLDFDDFDDLVRGWLPLTLAVNSLNRSMGLNDPYPFVLSEAPIQKLRFVHELVEEGAEAPRAVA